MGSYLTRRLLQFVPVFVGASILIFAIMRVVPGDPALLVVVGPGGDSGKADPKQLAQVRAQLGLDDSLPVQYLHWVEDLAHGDLGTSIFSSRDVTGLLKDAGPATAELALLSVVISVTLGLGLGTLSALRPGGGVDYGARLVSLAGLAAPSFWTGLLMLLVMSVYFNWQPPLNYEKLWDDPASNLQQMIWPALALGFEGAAVVSRMTRSQMLEVARADYVRTARAKGLSARIVVLRHMLRSALPPIVTLIGNRVIVLLGATVVLESLFRIPGMGTSLIGAINRRDYVIIQGIVLVYTAIVLGINLLADLANAALDPRVKAGM